MTSAIRKYGLIGHPIAHSLSPRIHSDAFHTLGISAFYTLEDTAEKGLEATVERLVRSGFSGWNVTMPDKTAMCDLCDELSEAASIGRSVNTVICRNGRLRGETTDGAGFLYAVREMGLSVENCRILLLGAGGAASSVLIACALAGAPSVTVFFRSESSRMRILALCRRLGESPAAKRTSVRILPVSSLTEDPSLLSESDLLVNATNVGMEPDTDASLIPDEQILPKSLAVFDAIYHPAKTKLLTIAEKAGCLTANGFPMLLGQAAESFRLWTGLEMPPLTFSLS